MLLCYATGFVQIPQQYSQNAINSEEVQWHQQRTNKKKARYSDLLQDMLTTSSTKNTYFNNGQKKLACKEALALYNKLTSDGFKPDLGLTIAVIKACSHLKDLQTGIRVHNEVKSHGLSNVYVSNTLMDMYSKCGYMSEAHRIFDELPTRNQVAWNTLILGYTECGEFQVALEFFECMNSGGLKPDGRTFVGALKACAGLALEEEYAGIGVKLKCLERGMAIHSYASRSGFELNVYVVNSLIDMYGKCSSMEDAQAVFDRNPKPCRVSWNSLIMGYAEYGKAEQALILLGTMVFEGFELDSRTVVAALKAVSSLALREDKEGGENWVKMCGLERCMVLHSLARQKGLESNLFVANAFIDTYGKCGSVLDAQSLFDKLPYRDVVAWSNLILAYAENNEGKVALNLFEKMRKQGIKPHAGTYIAALKACGSLGALEEGTRLDHEISQLPFSSTAIVATCIVDLYAKCGCMHKAKAVFDSMHRKDIVAWNTLLSGYADQGDTHNVFQVFEDMKEQQMQPNCVTHLAVLTACSHAGLINKAKEIFKEMDSPKIEHYSCVIDMLGRANQLEEACREVDNMPYKPNKSIWTTLLSCSNKWENVRVAKRAFDELIKFDASAPYLLMTNQLRSYKE